MNHRLTLVAAAILGLPSIAMSQTTSSVTIYGRIDTSINVQKTTATATTRSATRTFLSPDTPWLGFRGSEDLGGGLRAYFKMEHGFNVDTGTAASATQFWNREAYVGLGSTSLGSIQMGSQFTPSLFLTARLDPYGRTTSGAIMPMFQQAPPLAGWLGYTPQFNNSIQYISPSFGGVQVKVLTAAGEGVAALPAGPGGRALSSALEYTMGNRLFAGLSYDKVKITGALVGRPASPSVTLETIQAGITYRFDILKLHGYYIQTEADGGHSMKGGMVGVSVPVGTGEFASTYQKRQANDAANTDAQTIALQYTHFLSKRTSIYVGGAKQLNKGGATFGVWPSRLEAGPTPAGADVTAVQIGMRHYF